MYAEEEKNRFTKSAEVTKLQKYLSYKLSVWPKHCDSTPSSSFLLKYTKKQWGWV